MKRIKGDRRILGDGGFIEKVVSDSREIEDRASAQLCSQAGAWEQEKNYWTGTWFLTCSLPCGRVAM
jgi:hypothetical protein